MFCVITKTAIKDTIACKVITNETPAAATAGVSSLFTKKTVAFMKKVCIIHFSALKQ